MINLQKNYLSNRNSFILKPGTGSYRGCVKTLFVVALCNIRNFPKEKVMNQKSIFGIRQIFVNKNARWTEVGLAVGVSVDEDPPLERVKRWPVQWLRVWRAPIPYSIFVIDARGGRGGR